MTHIVRPGNLGFDRLATLSLGKGAFQLACWIVLGLNLALGGNARSEIPVFVRHTFVGTNFFVPFRPNTTQWLQLETSSDLRSWTVLVSLATGSSEQIITYGDDTAGASGIRFYRISYPSSTLDRSRAIWREQYPAVHRYRLLRVGPPTASTGNISKIIAGTVTVNAGRKEVTEVTVNSEPSLEFSPQDFPTIDELFDMLAEAGAQGVRLVWARFDPGRGFPFLCFFDQPPLPGGRVSFLISDFTVLPDS